MASRLQFHMINLIKNLLRFERNQQVMSNASFIDNILYTCKYVLNDETHFLNSAIQHIFERLATQSINSKCLREYLRLGTIFESSSHESSTLSEDKTASTLIPLNRVKCLISMTTPRDTKLYMETSFIEFNMYMEGFGCIFLPSIAPQLTTPPSIVAMGMVAVGNDSSVNGGVGCGERTFPPQSGLSYSTWIYIEKFGTFPAVAQIHPIRILTLIRHSKLKDTFNSCLSIFLSPKNRSLFISTEDCLLQHQKTDQNIKQTDHTAKFNCSELFQEGQWLHLCIVLNRAVLKNSTVTLFVNSNLIGTQKLHYLNINAANGGMAANSSSNSSTSIHAVIGTLPIFRMQSPVVWRQASCYLIEDAVTSHFVQSLYSLGANYLGSFQSPPIDSPDTPLSIPEEKLVFGLHAQKAFEMTLAKFRKVYNKSDSKVIGKQLNIPSHESVTPLRILSNTATQLSGGARSVGGVIIGYMGVSTFQPMPVFKTVESIGGVQLLLGLIAMANDVEFMYAGVKALVCMCKASTGIARDMERLNAYQLLAMLYKKKSGMLNSHILNLTFSLVVLDDSGKEQAIISNLRAFDYLLGDLNIWYSSPADIHRSLHERFNDLLNDQQNVKVFYRIGMLRRLLYMIKEPNASSLNENNLKSIFSTIRILIVEAVAADDLVTLGQYLVSLLPNAFITNENHIADLDFPSANSAEFNLIYMIRLRNRLMVIIDEIVAQSPSSTKSIHFQEELQRLLGLDWLLLFMQPHVHKTTVVLSCKILFTLLLNMQNLNRFKDSLQCGGWLLSIFLQNKLQNETNGSSTAATPDTPTVSTPNEPLTAEINMEACSAPGFQLMQVYFAKNPQLVELYYLLFALLFDAQRIKEMSGSATSRELDLNSICQYVFDKSFDSEQTLFCKINTDVSLDVSIILLGMIRSLMNGGAGGGDEAVGNYAIILLQIFRFMYHNSDEFRAMASNADFLAALIATLYPHEELSHEEQMKPLPTEIKSFAEAICDQKSSEHYQSFLSVHPARKLVMDFLRDLLNENLVNNTVKSSAASSIMDIIMASLPESQLKRNQEFLTECFKTIIDYLMASDLFNEHVHSTPHQVANLSVIMQNFFNLIEQLVSKLWDGSYRREAKEVFETIVRFLNNLKKKAYSNICNEPLINSMNRVLLFQLSRPCESLVEQVAMLEVLHKMTNLKALILSSTNFQSEFFACVTHCLLQLTLSDEHDVNLVNSSTQWYVSPINPVGGDKLEGSIDKLSTNAKSLINAAAQRVWLDLYLAKKSVLEECLKVTLNSIGKNPTLDQLRPLLTEPAFKIWTSFIEGEKKLPEKIQSHIQAKFQRVTGGISTMTSGFSRVVSLKKQKKEIPRLSLKELNETAHAISLNVNKLKEFCDLDYRRYFRLNEQRHVYVVSEWLKMEKDLLRERALWGDDQENRLNKWKLDFTEGPNRQRKRMLLNNDDFYRHYSYRPEIELLKPNKKYKIPFSLDSKQYMEQFHVNTLLGFYEQQQEAMRIKAEGHNRLCSIDLDDTNSSKFHSILFINVI